LICAGLSGLAPALWGLAKAMSGQSTFTVNSSVVAVSVSQRFGFIAQTPPETANSKWRGVCTDGLQTRQLATQPSCPFCGAAWLVR